MTEEHENKTRHVMNGSLECTSFISAHVSMVTMNRLLDRVRFLFIITMATKNVNNRLLDRVHFLYMVPVYLWQPGYDDKLDECGGEPELEHTHTVTVAKDSSGE